MRAHEASVPQGAAALAEIKLTDEQIREAGRQFAVDLKDAEDLLNMRRTMPRDTYRDWVNAVGYLQILQNALAKGDYEDRAQGLWKHPVVRR